VQYRGGAVSGLVQNRHVPETGYNTLLLSLISQNLKTSHDRDHAHSRDTVIPMLKHHMANQCTKFEVSSFSRSGDILGGSKKLNGSRFDHNHAPFGVDFLFVW